MSDFIKDFWNGNAEKYKGSHQASWGDEYAIKLESQNISSYIKDGDDVLDVGCANGFAAIMQCAAHDLKVYDRRGFFRKHGEIRAGE